MRTYIPAMDLIGGGVTLTNLSKFNVLLGKNGCGKSTVLKGLDGALDKNAFGQVRYISPERVSSWRRKGSCAGRPHRSRTPGILSGRLSRWLLGARGPRWEDGPEGTLESKLATLVAGLTVAGEARFRRGLAETEERERQWRAHLERQRQERLAMFNRERLERIRESGELLRRAEDMRRLVARVSDAVGDGTLNLAPGVLDAWLTWARAEADQIDPVLSGQVMSHLLPPADAAGFEPGFT